MRFRFNVPGPPVPQPRPRAVLVGKGVNAKARIHELTHVKKNGVRVEHPIVAYRKAVELCFRNSVGVKFTCPLFVSCRFIFPRVNRLKGGGRHRYDVRKNDGDNLVKAVWDALNGVAWDDDGQIVEWAGDRWYASEREEPHTEVMIETLVPTEKELF